jgi:hypothetical protein
LKKSKHPNKKDWDCQDRFQGLDSTAQTSPSIASEGEQRRAIFKLIVKIHQGGTWSLEAVRGTIQVI